MASSRQKGIIGIVGVIVAAVGFGAGSTMYKIDTSGNINKSETFYTSYSHVTNCTNTGGSASSQTCYFQNPFVGSGLIKRVDLITEANPSGTTFDCGVVSSLSASGTQLRDNGNSGSGKTLTMSTGSVILPPAWYVKCTAGKTPGSAFDGVLYTELLEYDLR